MTALAKTAAARGNVEPTDPKMTATLTECHTVAEWLGAIGERPDVFGLRSDPQVGQMMVQMACPSQNRSYPVCADADRLGLLF